MALSDTRLRNAKPAEKNYSISDGRGLSILITTKGNKWWRFRYRFMGKYKLMSLGVYDEVSLAEARQRRDDARKLLAQIPPIDPVVYKKTQANQFITNQSNSFENIAQEWAETFFVNKSESHKVRTFRRLEVYLFPWVGKMPIVDITAPIILNVLKKPVSQNKLETAHRTLQAAGQVFRYAVQTGRAERDITADLKGALPSPKVKHMPTFTDPSDVAELLRAFEGFRGTFTVESALKLSPLVFVRPVDIRKAKWADIDLDSGEWRFVVSKIKKEFIVPLSKQAISILKELYPLTGHREYVFPGGHDPRKPMSEAAINASLRRLGYDTKKQITGHGFRAMARTILHERLNIDPAIIEHQLAHKVPDTLGTAYNRTKFLNQRRKMMQEWADYLDQLKNS